MKKLKTLIEVMKSSVNKNNYLQSSILLLVFIRFQIVFFDKLVF